MTLATKRTIPFLAALLLAFALLPFAAQTAEASAYYYFEKPTTSDTYKVGDKIPIEFYAGVCITTTHYSAAGTPSYTTYETMPATVKVYKGDSLLYSKSFTYTSGTRLSTTFTPKTSGTLKLCIYGRNYSLTNTAEVLQETMTIKVKAAKASTVKKIKPKITVERTAKKAATITCTNDCGFGMKVYRATAKNGAYKLIKTTKGAKFTDKKLNAKKVYYYKVRLYAKASGKTYLSKWSAKQKAGKYKPGITLSYTPSKGVKVSWKQISGAGYYLVCRNTTGLSDGLSVIACVDKGDRVYYDKDVEKGKTYYYGIVGEVGDDEKVVGKYMSDSYKIKVPA